MVLIRICHTADLPTPDEIIRTLGGAVPVPRSGRVPGGPSAPEPRTPLNFAPEAPAATAPVAADTEPASFADVVELVGVKRDAKLKLHLEDHVSLLKFEPGRLELSLLPGAPPGLVGELSEKLSTWTGRRWVVSVGRGMGARPIGELRRAAEAEALEAARTDPAVAAILSAFPEAEVKAVRAVKPATKREA
jgi:DNA polymerase-3 subunit gamma/tau